MLFISLMLRPWILYMKRLSCVPRVLADDLLVMSLSPKLDVFIEGYEATHIYLADMGAKVAPNKSYTFSSSADFRGWLKDYVWPALGKCIVTFINFRDLGSHLNFSMRPCGATLTARIGRGTEIINRIRWLPVSFEEKGRRIAGNTLALG